MAILEGTAESAGFIVVSMTPDVCKSPGTPIPYNIVGFLDNSILTSVDVRFQGFWVFDTMSRVATVVGNEAGLGGGLVSLTNLGMCKPIIGPSSTVFCNGNPVCRHEMSVYQMNMLGPEGASNTLGKVVYLGAMMSGPVAPKGCLPAGANTVLGAETPAEVSPLDKIKNSLSIDSVEDAVSMSQNAYKLSQVDWSNPSAALGALGGVAGRAGFGDLASGLGMAKTAMKTDWSDPASVLSAASSMAGPLMDWGQRAMDHFNEPTQSNLAQPVDQSSMPGGQSPQPVASEQQSGESSPTTHPIPGFLPSNVANVGGNNLAANDPAPVCNETNGPVTPTVTESPTNDPNSWRDWGILGDDQYQYEIPPGCDYEIASDSGATSTVTRPDGTTVVTYPSVGFQQQYGIHGELNRPGVTITNGNPPRPAPVVPPPHKRPGETTTDEMGRVIHH